MTDTWDEVKRWRHRAEELRTLADQFTISASQETLRRVAETYDRLADEAEARLTGNRRSTDKAG